MDESGTRFSDIEEELVENILTRLPVKSLKQLSCVNKWWYNLIQSPYFISRHYIHHSSTNVKLLVKRSLVDCCTTGKDVISLLSENDGDFSHQSIPFLNENNTISIIGPCINGIICVKIFTEHESFDDIALWNVATRDYHILPKLQFSAPPKAYLEPTIEGLGFGWVPETNEYKLVMAIHFWQESCNHDDCIPYHRDPEFFVYTLSTNSWKLLSLEHPFCASFLNSEPPESHIYVDGVCYWVYQALDGIYKICSFHVRDEVFGSLPFPDIEISNHGFLNLTIHMLGGCIALINNQSDPRDFIFLAEIWVMEESWIKKFTIGPLLNIKAKLGFVKDELFLEDKSGQLLSINVNSHELKNLGIRGKDTLGVLEYVESLVSIKRWL